MKAGSQNVIQKLGLLSTEEAAKYLGKSLATFNQRISKHIKEAGTYENRNYYRMEDLDNWIASHFGVNDSAKVPSETKNAN